MLDGSENFCGAIASARSRSAQSNRVGYMNPELTRRNSSANFRSELGFISPLLWSKISDRGWGIPLLACFFTDRGSRGK